MTFIKSLRNHYNKNHAVICPGYDINLPCYDAGRVEGDVGIELEIEGANLPAQGTLLVEPIASKSKGVWVVKQDGSLRGGLEYVTSGAIYVSEVREMVSGLFKAYNKAGSRINNSNRCSTHIHVNVSDLKVNQINSAIALWITFQKCLIEWNGIERVSNHYCLSSRDEEAMLEAWVDYLRNGNRPGRGHRDGVKYTALNIIPIWTQGSLEFRCGGRPDDEDHIVWWAKICNAIVRYAAENFQNPMELGYALSEQGPEQLLRRVLDRASLGERTTDRIYNELTENGTLHVDAMNDFRDVQYIVYAFPWDSLMERINSEHIPNPFADKAKQNKARPRFGDVNREFVAAVNAAAQARAEGE
jgi:hypothetical protein